jgi:hypothetical protein
MIRNDEEFLQTLEQLERMYQALASLRRDILPKNRRNFAVLAEGPLDYIRQFHEELEQYRQSLLADSQPRAARAKRPALGVPRRTRCVWSLSHPNYDPLHAPSDNSGRPWADAPAAPAPRPRGGSDCAPPAFTCGKALPINLMMN